MAAASTAVAVSGVIATAGGDDQRDFHLPTVMLIRESFPHIDFVGLPTATGPLYHLVVAALSGPFGFGAAATQAVGAIFAVALAVLAVAFAQAAPTWTGRALAVAPLLLSAYFWQSALWMLTDDAAMLFAFAALAVSLRFDGARAQLAVGVLIAAAIATRQNSVWLLLPACAAYAVAGGGPRRPDIAALTRICAPGLGTLAGLTVLWGGIAPPAGRAMNAMHRSPTSLSFVAAVAAVFLVPVVLAVSPLTEVRSWAREASVVGVVAALPAVVFASAATLAPDDARRGGLVWSAVGSLPDVAGRSPVLIVLAFVGGFAATVLVRTVPARAGVVLATALPALAAVLVFGAQLYQKYAELPVAVLTVLLLVPLFAAGRVRRRWPLICLAALQAALTAGLVGLPILQSL
ncbi:hypothetical protein SAMN04489765_4627 [Tsukamurella pulmonis]|uniref:Dolichyl-phosphate-mannose-protein mannosyltransferase n=1 Tax=Tsukamurella pulmonis TaxID=47312 RepID=A0A1H1HV63_9ACTN|nr:hypothetical protein SAMN04489765_4627 [Tsukamurella pulmonis]SUP13037.1 Uncharacterised protein [Tsukamurella pulmonis]